MFKTRISSSINVESITTSNAEIILTVYSVKKKEIYFSVKFW